MDATQQPEKPIKYTNYAVLALVVVLAVAALMLLPKKEEAPDVAITTFEECADAGYPIMQSFPQRCSVPGGATFTEETVESPEVVVATPSWGGTVTSPLTVSGKAKGSWFFEANLPITLKDSAGNVLAQKGAQAIGDWMTTSYVEFTVTLEFAAPATDLGVLLIEKDNPSGMPENGASYAIPVRFR